jgi:hypothetical protein
MGEGIAPPDPPYARIIHTTIQEGAHLCLPVQQEEAYRLQVAGGNGLMEGCELCLGPRVN